MNETKNIDCEKQYRVNNPEKVKESKRKWNEKNPNYYKNYCIKNKDEIKIVKKQWRQNNPDKLKKSNQRHRLKHRDKINERIRKWSKQHLIKNENCRIKKNLRNRIWNGLKGHSRSAHTMELIGCTIEELKLYLEKQWLPKMRWDNWGKGDRKWNIHHTKQCASFDLSYPEQQRLCFHYSNLMPMWEKDHRLLKK